jgi:hypothetical protein
MLQQGSQQTDIYAYQFVFPSNEEVCKIVYIMYVCTYLFIYLAFLSCSVITRAYVQLQGDTHGMWLA